VIASLKKTLAGFLRRGLILSNSAGYFFTELMLHFLPLQQQQSFVCALKGDAAKDAAKVAIKRRYFIKFSCLSFSYPPRLRD